MDRELLKSRLTSLGIGLGVWLIVSIFVPFFAVVRVELMIWIVSMELIRMVIRDSNWKLIVKIGIALLIFLLGLGCLMLTDPSNRLVEVYALMILVESIVDLILMVRQRK